MALSPPFPLHLFPHSSYPSSPSLCALYLQSQNYSPNSFKTLKLKIYCSHRSIQADTQQLKVASNPTKSKRKPRPSFFEQIRHKWSSKIESPRKKLPWQEQESSKQQSSGVLENESKIDRNESVSDPASFGLPNRLISAPWSHGSKLRETQFYSETEIPLKNGGKGKSVDGFPGDREKPKNVDKEVDFNGKFEEEAVEIDEIFRGHYEKTKNVEKEGDFNGKFKEEAVEIDEIPIGLLRDINDVSSNEKQIGNFEASVGDNSGSNRLPWKRERNLEGVERERERKSYRNLAETIIPEHELQRLKNVALRMKERIKVGAAGITQALVDSIHEKWKDDEIVKLKFEGPSALNMKRTHETLVSKTGGLVIWRSGSSIVLYRGMTYKLHCVKSYTNQNPDNVNMPQCSKDVVTDVTQTKGVKESFIPDSSRYWKDLSKEELMDLSELNHLLDELGPRFEDWSGHDPLPVDADLLPSEVPGYKPPIRVLPYGRRHCLRNREMTSFRRFARTTPPHFALGRNRDLQGLAKAMVKLWERSAIAKIAIKRGVLNTCNERMTEELKKLTGGTLLSRNKDYIVFYRGNDFLPPAVTETLKVRRKLTDLCQDEEELARQGASALIDSYRKAAKGPFVAGTLAETMAATSRWGNQPSSEDVEQMMRDLALDRRASLVRYLEKKLALAKEKVRKAEKALSKVQEYLEPAELPTDLETLSDEERFLFRKIGLSMKPFLLLGTRGVFDGTIENMHLHWKFRELVKIIVRGKSFAQVKHIAISLEAESGGVLVSVDKTTKGYAIIVYRGKNYQCPHALRPRNLLTRRQALARSIELQRREALKHHILDLEERIGLLKSELEEMNSVEEIDDKTLHSRLDDAYSSDDNMEEDEGEEAYLEIYDSGTEDGNVSEEFMFERGSNQSTPTDWILED